MRTKSNRFGVVSPKRSYVFNCDTSQRPFSCNESPEKSMSTIPFLASCIDRTSQVNVNRNSRNGLIEFRRHEQTSRFSCDVCPTHFVGATSFVCTMHKDCRLDGRRREVFYFSLLLDAVVGSMRARRWLLLRQHDVRETTPSFAVDIDMTHDTSVNMSRPNKLKQQSACCYRLINIAYYYYEIVLARDMSPNQCRCS